MKDLMWRAEVSHDGFKVGYQENGWFALPDEDVAKMVQQGTDAVMYAKSLEQKGGKAYMIEFTGSVTENGVATADAPVAVELDAAGLVKYLQKASKLSDFLVDWAQDDVQHGKKTGWDHSKAKKHKPGKP